jgi:septal ring factor EnvC (AmiA/AmiB activator)
MKDKDARTWIDSLNYLITLNTTEISQMQETLKLQKEINLKVDERISRIEQYMDKYADRLADMVDSK